MRTLLRTAALIVLLGALLFWAAKGANRGWTKNDVPTTQIDAVTGIEGTTWEKRFVPGVDFLAAALLAATFLAGVSFFFRSKKLEPDQPISTEPVKT